MVDHKEINTGLILEEPDPGDYIFGASPVSSNIIFDNGHGWLKYTQPPESQKNRLFDSFSCVTFATLKAICYHLKTCYNIEIDLSEAFTAAMSGTIPGRGNSVRAVLESARKDGWSLEIDYPSMSDTMTEAQWFRQPPLNIRIKAKGVTTEWKLNYELVGQSTFGPSYTRESVIDALKYSPVIVTGYAWDSENGIYYDRGRQANHCFLAVDYDAQGRIIVDDSYPFDWNADGSENKNDYLKTLDTSYRFWSAHKITLTPVKESMINKVIRMLKGVKINFYKSAANPKLGMANGEVYIVKDSTMEMKKVETIGDILAIMEMNFGMKKTDWFDLSRYNLVKKFKQ